MKGLTVHRAPREFLFFFLSFLGLLLLLLLPKRFGFTWPSFLYHIAATLAPTCTHHHIPSTTYPPFETSASGKRSRFLSLPSSICTATDHVIFLPRHIMSDSDLDAGTWV